MDVVLMLEDRGVDKGVDSEALEDIRRQALEELNGRRSLCLHDVPQTESEAKS